MPPPTDHDAFPGAAGPGAPGFLRWPDPRLATSGARVVRADAEVAAQLTRLTAVMRGAGLGWIAGAQLGIMRRIGVLDMGEGALRLLNPSLLWESRDRSLREESAPGFPGLVGMVSRADVVRLGWADEHGGVLERVLTGVRAAAAAALVDQIEGVPLIDRLAPSERRAAAALLARRPGPAALPRDRAARALPGARAPLHDPAARAARARAEAEDAQLSDAASAADAPAEFSPAAAPGAAGTTADREAPRMRLIFMGTPDFSTRALDALVEAGHEIAAVYTQPPRPAGRGKKLRPTPVQARAEALGLEVRHPRSLRPEEEQEALRALGADLAVVVAYGLILPKGALEAPKMGCVNIHASLLPRWRGAAPIQRAIMAGDAASGVCIMRMEEGLDTGPVILRRETPIGPADTAETLHDRLAAIGAAAVVDALGLMAAGEAGEEVQPEEGVTYAAKIDKAEAKIDWTRPAAEVDRLIRGLSPFPGAWFEHEGARVKALLSELVEGAPEGAAPGTTLDDALTVACGSGAVRILRLQRAGKGAMDAAEALRGLPVPKGATLG